MGKYFGWVGVGGVEWGLMHCLIMSIDVLYQDGLARKNIYED